MSRRRGVARVWRRLRRPSWGWLVAASIVLHLATVGLTLWLTRGDRPLQRESSAPLIVELPPAAPGTPLVRPEVPAPSARATPAPPAVAARPAPPRPAPEARPSPPLAARPPAPPTGSSVPPPVPTVEPSPAPAPPAVAARPPESDASPPAPRPEPESASAAPAESPLAGKSFSLLGPRLDLPPPPGAGPSSGTGGLRPEGAGAGDSGFERDGQAGVPLNTPDPRYAEYFAQIKRQIEANWVYPYEAVRQNQSGQGLVGFVLRKNGSLREVEVVRSSGFDILDRYLVNAIRLASPFPAIPDRIATETLPVVFTFTYVIDHGIRVFGLR